MADLNSLIVFARVAETMSFSEAARRLNMPISTVSRKVADLEDQLGVRLIERSTRSLRLTDVGADVLAEAQRGAEVSEAVQSIVSNQLTEVRGLLRLSAPPSIADSVLAPILIAFQASYPRVRVHVLVTDRFVDHIAEGVDLAFRVGALKDSALVARTILTYRRRLLASPGYLLGRKGPTRPAELTDENLLAFSSSTGEHSWTFCKGEASETIRFQPHLAMNDYAGLATALASGSGIGDLPPIVRPDFFQSGKLVEVMPDWTFRAETLSMVHLGNRHIPRPVRLFKDFASQAAPSMFPALPV
ncbi:MAG: LysR substrate-binding domain-containing protein [Hyphomicrobiales bacterium]